MIDPAAILSAIASNQLPAPVAHRALDLLIEQARRAGELDGFTRGQHSTLTELEQQRHAAAVWTAALYGVAPGPADDEETSR